MRTSLIACLIALCAASACNSGNPSAADAGMAVGGQSSAFENVEPTTECNDEFLGLSEPVRDAVDETDQQYHDLFDAQLASVAASEKQHPVAADEFAAIWDIIALDSGDQPQQMLRRVADLWRTLANTPLLDFDTIDEGFESIAEVYEELAIEFERCDTAVDVSYRLRGEARFLQHLAGNW